MPHSSITPASQHIPSAPPDAVASQIHSQARGSSFHLPMWLLPKAKRDALFALYAVCRGLDDAVDDAPNLASAEAALNEWERALNNVLSGAPVSHPLLQAMAAAHGQFHFDPQYFHDMFGALRMDAHGKMLYPSSVELEDYCYGVACCVGLLSMQIFGCTSQHAKPFAVALGHALQLTNILRDVVVDARIGRVYLPHEWVEACTDKTLPLPAALLHDTPSLRDAYHMLATAAHAKFLEADQHARHLPPRDIAPALAMRDVYANYWRQLKAQDFMPAETGKLPIGPLGKLTLIARMASYLTNTFHPVKL